jgi:hypothetical protein
MVTFFQYRDTILPINSISRGKKWGRSVELNIAWSVTHKYIAEVLVLHVSATLHESSKSLWICLCSIAVRRSIQSVCQQPYKCRFWITSTANLRSARVRGLSQTTEGVFLIVVLKPRISVIIPRYRYSLIYVYASPWAVNSTRSHPVTRHKKTPKIGR